MLSVGRCGVARLQMNVGHMDRMHCFIDSTSILVKMKSVSLYNCRTVYVCHCFTFESNVLSENALNNFGAPCSTSEFWYEHMPLNTFSSPSADREGTYAMNQAIILPSLKI